MIKVNKMESDDKFWAIFWVTTITFLLIMSVLFGGEPDLMDGIVKYISK